MTPVKYPVGWMVTLSLALRLVPSNARNLELLIVHGVGNLQPAFLRASFAAAYPSGSIFIDITVWFRCTLAAVPTFCRRRAAYPERPYQPRSSGLLILSVSGAGMCAYVAHNPLPQLLPVLSNWPLALLTQVPISNLTRVIRGQLQSNWEISGLSLFSIAHMVPKNSVIWHSTRIFPPRE